MGATHHYRAGWILLLAALTMGGCSGLKASAGGDDPLASLLGPAPWPAEATHHAPALDADALARAIHGHVNAIRAAHALPPLEWADPLAGIAAAHSRDMAAHGYFGHTSPAGTDADDRARAAGLATHARLGTYLVDGLGENLFLTHRFRAYWIQKAPGGTRRYTFEWKTLGEIAREAVDGWMQSATHRANLLSPLYRTAGIAVVHAGNEALFVTQNFSCRPSAQLAAK